MIASLPNVFAAAALLLALISGFIVAEAMLFRLILRLSRRRQKQRRIALLVRQIGAPDASAQSRQAARQMALQRWERQ